MLLGLLWFVGAGSENSAVAWRLKGEDQGRRVRSYEARHLSVPTANSLLGLPLM